MFVQQQLRQDGLRINITRAELSGHNHFPSVVLIKEVEMRNHLLVLTITAAILVSAIAASAQAPTAQQSPTTQPTPGGPVIQQQDQKIRDRLRERAQSGEEEGSDPDGCYRYHGAMMGMMGGGMMRRGLMMRVIFSLMDADSDGTLSLQEFQAASERVFKAMDADKDGTVTLEEMQDFMRGTSRRGSQQ
jgi:EF hand